MVRCEAQIGNTGNSVRLILVLGSSTKFKFVMQVWVAKQSCSSIWTVFHLTEPWQKETVGSLFLCVWSRAVLRAKEQSCVGVHPVVLTVFWEMGGQRVAYSLMNDCICDFLRLRSSWIPFLCTRSLLVWVWKGAGTPILLLKLQRLVSLSPASENRASQA